MKQFEAHGVVYKWLKILKNNSYSILGSLTDLYTQSFLPGSFHKNCLRGPPLFKFIR